MKKTRMTNFMKTLVTVMTAVCLLTVSSCKCDCDDDAKNDETPTSRSLVTIETFPTNVTCPGSCGPDPNCDINGYCTDMVCKRYLFCCHEIDATTFNNIVCTTSTGDAVPGKLIPANDLWTILDIVNCDRSYFQIGTPNICDGDNRDIYVQAVINVNKNVDVTYSMLLFKEIRDSFNRKGTPVENFKFYEAERTNEDGSPKPDIVFEAMDVNNNVLYYGDLSDLFP